MGPRRELRGIIIILAEVGKSNEGKGSNGNILHPQLSLLYIHSGLDY